MAPKSALLTSPGQARSPSGAAASKARAITPRPSPKRLQHVAKTVAKASQAVALAKGRPGDPKASAPKVLARRTASQSSLPSRSSLAARPSLPPPADVTTDDDWSRSPRLRGADSDQEAADDSAPSLENSGQLVLHNSAAESMGSARINGSLYEELFELRAENGSLKSQVSSTDRMVSKMEDLMDRFQTCEKDNSARLLSVEERSRELLSHEESQQILDGAELLAQERSSELMSSSEVFSRREAVLSSEIAQMAESKAPDCQSLEFASELAAARQDQSVAMEALSSARMQLAEKKGMIEEMSEFTEEGISEVEDALSSALHESSRYEEDAAAERATCEMLEGQVSALECKEQGSPPASRQGSLRFGLASSMLTVATGASVSSAKSLAPRPSVSFDIGLKWIANWIRLSSLLQCDSSGQVLRIAAASAAKRRKLTGSDLQSSGSQALPVEQLLLGVEKLKESMTSALEEAEEERAMWMEHEQQQQTASEKAKVALEDSMKETKVGRKEVVALKMQVAAIRSQMEKSRLSLQNAQDQDRKATEEALQKSCAHYEAAAAQEQAALVNCEAMVSSILADHKTKADEFEASKCKVDDELNVANRQVVNLREELAILKAGGSKSSTEVTELKAALEQAQRLTFPLQGMEHITGSNQKTMEMLQDKEALQVLESKMKELEGAVAAEVAEQIRLKSALEKAESSKLAGVEQPKQDIEPIGRTFAASSAPWNQEASELLAHLRKETAELRAELLELMSTHVPAEHVTTLRSEVESLASLLERSATTYQEELLSAQAGEFEAVIDANRSGTELRTAKMQSKELASRLSAVESARTPTTGDFVLQALPSPRSNHLTAAPRHEPPSLPSPAANRLMTTEITIDSCVHSSPKLRKMSPAGSSRLEAIKNTIRSPARSDLTFQGPPSPTLLSPALCSPASPSPASPTLASPLATEVLLIHFPDAPWPPPPEFQAELRSRLASLGATRMGGVAIRLHKGSIIAELIGSRTALLELKSLPLRKLSVLSYCVGFVRSSLPNNIMAMMAALEGPLASWEARTAALVAISAVDANESEELIDKLSGDTVAAAASVEACAALRHAVSSSEAAEAAVKVASLAGADTFQVEGDDAQRPAAKELTQHLRMQARRIAEDLRNAVQQFEDERRNIAIDAAKAHLSESTASALDSDPRRVVADAPELSELHSHLTASIPATTPHVMGAADTAELSKAMAIIATAQAEVVAEAAEVKSFQARFAIAEEASAELMDLKASMVQLEGQREALVTDGLGEDTEHVAEFQRLRETVQSLAAAHVAKVEADDVVHDELSSRDSLLELQQLGQRLRMEEAKESFQAGNAQSLARRLSEQEVVVAEANSELTSLQARHHAENLVFEQEAALVLLRLDQCTLNCETLEAAAHEERSKDEQAQLALQDSLEECEDLQRETHAMQAQVALANRHLREREAACQEIESSSLDQLMEARSEAHLEIILEAHEANQLRSEAAHCHSLGAEVAASLATHASETCDARLSASSITAEYKEASAQLRVIADNKEQIDNELLTVRGELQQQELLLSHERSLWLSARMEQEVQTRSLNAVATSHAEDLVEMQKALCSEELACRSAKEACERSAATSAHAASRPEDSVDNRAAHTSQASPRTRSSGLASHVLPQQDSSRWKGVVAAEASLSRAMQTLNSASDVLMEARSGLQNPVETSGVLAMLIESRRKLQAAAQVLEVSQAELTRTVQEAINEVAIVALQNTAEMRTEKLLLVEAELAAEKFTKATLYAEFQQLEIASADEKQCRVLESLSRKDEPTSMASAVLAQTGAGLEDTMLVKVLHELQEAEAAEASAAQKFEQTQSLSSYPASFTVSPQAVPVDTAVHEEAIALIEDENAAVQRELEQTMAEIQGLHEEKDSLHVSEGVGQLVLQASQLASQNSSRQHAVQAELKTSADECSLWIAISNQREVRAEHWQQAAVTQAAEVRELEGRLALEGFAVRQQAADAHAAEVRELEGCLALETAAWRSLRDGSAVYEHEHACGQLELEGLCAGLQQDTAVLGVRCLALTQELCMEREEASQLLSLREELERKGCLGETKNTGLEGELMCSNVEAEKTIHKLESRCLALTQELCLARGEADQLSSLQEELDGKQCVAEAKHAGLEEELMHSKMEAETSGHKLERCLKLQTSGSVETTELSRSKMKAEPTSRELEARLELLTSQFDETKALCRAEMRTEAAKCRTSVEQMNGYMSSLQPELAEFQHALEERSAKAREREEALEQMLALQSQKHKDSAEMNAMLSRELDEVCTEQQLRSSRSSEEIEMLLSTVDSSEQSAALEHLRAALDVARSEEREASRNASELQVQVKVLQSSSKEVAQAAQATTASMRSQLVKLFEQLDARGQECRVFEERAIQEEYGTREWRSEQMRSAASHDHEVAQLKSAAAFKTEEMQRLTSEMALHSALALEDAGAGALDIRELTLSESADAAGKTAWQTLESMLEEETPMILSQTEAAASDFEHMFIRLQAELRALVESSPHNPAVRELASRYELLRRSKDALLCSLPDAKTLAAHSDQLMRSKAALRSVLPMVAKLTAQVHRGSEAEVELKRAQSEVESLQHVAEIHAQHSLKVHRLMCEDAQHRLLPQRRVVDGGPASPQRPAMRRSSALRAWQSSLENQSQALMDRSLMLLNRSADTGSDADLPQPIAQHDGLAPLGASPLSSPRRASPTGVAQQNESRTGT